MSITLSDILAKMPKKYDEFRSCFVGSGELFFHLPISRNRWINDIDKELISFYRMLKSNPDKASKKFPHKISSTRSLKKMSEYLKTAHITRYCATGLLNNHGKNALCYLDPPDFPDTEDHKKLAEVVKNTEHMVLIKCKNDKLTRGLHMEEGFYFHQYDGEFLITNYEVEDEGVVKLF